MRILAAVALTVLVVAMLAKATTAKALYKVSRLSISEVAVSCENGADPTTYPKLNGLDALIISCGR
jgi:hypothetical protein